MKIRRYGLITNHCPNNIELEVNALLERGWQLYGSPCVASFSDETGIGEDMFIQAMILPESMEPEIA